MQSENGVENGERSPLKKQSKVKGKFPTLRRQILWSGAASQWSKTERYF